SIVRVLNEDGIVVAQSEDAAEWISRDLRDIPSVARQMRAKEISEVVRWPDGIVRITGSSTANEAPWLVSVGLPTDIAFAAVVSRLGWAAVFSSLALAMAFAIAWMLSG